VQLLLYATVRAWRASGGTRSAFLMVLVFVTMIQIAIGTRVRGGVDTALRSGVPRASALASIGVDHLHRTVALVVFGGSVLLVLWLRAKFPKESVLIRWAYVVSVLAAVQIGFGITMVYVSLEPIAQVGHLAIASLLLGAETFLLLAIPVHRNGCSSN